MASEIVYVPAPVHHGRVENFGEARARQGMSRGMFGAMMAHLSTKSKLEIAGLAAAGFFGSRGLAQYISEAGWLAKIGIDATNDSYGRAGICALSAYMLRNKQPIAAVGAGVAAVNEIVGPMIDGYIYSFAHPVGQQAPATVSGGVSPQPAGLPPAS